MDYLSEWGMFYYSIVSNLIYIIDVLTKLLILVIMRLDEALFMPRSLIYAFLNKKEINVLEISLLL